MRKNSVFFKRSSDFLKEYKQDWWLILAMTLASILITVPIYVHRIYSSSVISDFPEHIQYAKLIFSQHYQLVPILNLAHPAYQLLLIAVYLLAFQKVGMFAIAVLIQVVVQIFTVLIIYFWFGRGQQNRNWLRAIWAISLTLVAPVMVFAFWDKLFYLGYIGLSTYHNPTIRLLQPVALLGFFCAMRIFTLKSNSWKVVLSSIFLVVFSALIKPNLLLCILPAIGLMVVIYLFRRKPIDWRLLLVGFFVPGILILLVQLWINYILPGNGNGSIVFSPLGVMSGYSGFLLPKFFLSILFPLAVLIFNFRRVVRDNTLMLAWVGFFAGVLQMYLLAESGNRFGNGNFIWGAQIMLFILFVASARFLWREKLAPEKLSKREKTVVLIIYAAHFLAGIAYYVSLMILAGFS
ncbi:MAG: hypothetical protein ABSA23_03535 [Anaerolineales bacterium]|jgi:hypothetical protein